MWLFIGELLLAGELTVNTLASKNMLAPSLGVMGCLLHPVLEAAEISKDNGDSV